MYPAFNYRSSRTRQPNNSGIPSQLPYNHHETGLIRNRFTGHNQRWPCTDQQAFTRMATPQQPQQHSVGQRNRFPWQPARGPAPPRQAHQNILYAPPQQWRSSNVQPPALLLFRPPHVELQPSCHGEFRLPSERRNAPQIQSGSSHWQYCPTRGKPDQMSYGQFRPVGGQFVRNRPPSAMQQNQSSGQFRPLLHQSSGQFRPLLHQSSGQIRPLLHQSSARTDSHFLHGYGTSEDVSSSSSVDKKIVSNISYDRTQQKCNEDSAESAHAVGTQINDKLKNIDSKVLKPSDTDTNLVQSNTVELEQGKLQNIAGGQIGRETDRSDQVSMKTQLSIEEQIKPSLTDTGNVETLSRKLTEINMNVEEKKADQIDSMSCEVVEKGEGLNHSLSEEIKDSKLELGITQVGDDKGIAKHRTEIKDSKLDPGITQVGDDKGIAKHQTEHNTAETEENIESQQDYVDASKKDNTTTNFGFSEKAEVTNEKLNENYCSCHTSEIKMDCNDSKDGQTSSEENIDDMNRSDADMNGNCIEAKQDKNMEDRVGTLRNDKDEASVEFDCSKESDATQIVRNTCLHSIPETEMDSTPPVENQIPTIQYNDETCKGSEAFTNGNERVHSTGVEGTNPAQTKPQTALLSIVPEHNISFRNGDRLGNSSTAMAFFKDFALKPLFVNLGPRCDADIQTEARTDGHVTRTPGHVTITKDPVIHLRRIDQYSMEVKGHDGCPGSVDVVLKPGASNGVESEEDVLAEREPDGGGEAEGKQDEWEDSLGDFDEDDEDDDELLQAAPKFLKAVQEIMMNPAPATPEKWSRPHDFSDDGLSPAKVTKWQRPVPETKISLDSLLAEKLDNKDREEEMHEINTELKEDLAKGGFAEILNQVEEKQADAPLQEEHQAVLQKFDTEEVRICDDRPGVTVFQAGQYQSLFDQTLHPTHCGFQAGTKAQMLDRHLENLTAAGYQRMLTSGIIQMCFDRVKCQKELLRWIFLLLSVHQDIETREGCHRTLMEILSSRQLISSVWCPSITDILHVFINYGADLEDLIPASLGSVDTVRSRLEQQKLPQLSKHEGRDGVYPQENMFLVLQVIAMATQGHKGCYCGTDATLLLAMLCKTALDSAFKHLCADFPFSNCIAMVIKQYTDADWDQHCLQACRVIAALTTHHHNQAHIAGLLPAGHRGAYLQRRVSYLMLHRIVGTDQSISDTELQNLEIRDLHDLIPGLKELLLNDPYRLSSIVTLLDLCVGVTVSLTSRERDELRRLTDLVKRIQVRDSFVLLDRTRVKDMLVRLTSRWYLNIQAMKGKQTKIFEYGVYDSPSRLKIEKIRASENSDDSDEAES